MAERSWRQDLHTHPLEAIGVSAAADVTEEHIRRIDNTAAAMGLDVVAVTEHNGWALGETACRISDDIGTTVLFLPGQEWWFFPVEVVEVRLPSSNVFRFLAHPGAPADFRGVFRWLRPWLHGIEVINCSHQWHMNEASLRELAEEEGLLTVHSSDAHELATLGKAATNVSVAELEERAAANQRGPLTGTILTAKG